MNRWVEPDIRDEIVSFIGHWQVQSEWPQRRFCQALGLSEDRLLDWRRRYAQPNAHNGQIPRHFWLDEAEKQAIIDFYREHQDDGYRRCTYMMIDQDIAYASAATVYRVLKAAEVMRSRRGKSGRRGDGFEQPLEPHEQWHTDLTYIKVGACFYYLILILDGYSRFIVHWDLRESMTDVDVGIAHQAARELYPGTTPRIISDNGKQFTGKEFEAFITLHGLKHTTTSPYYPQSNGKLERFNGSLKHDYLNRRHLTDADHARQLIGSYIDYYNHQRLHSAIGYITPADMLAGRRDAIHAERDHKLTEARQNRKHRFLSQPPATTQPALPSSEAQAGRRISAPCGPAPANAGVVMPPNRLNEAMRELSSTQEHHHHHQLSGYPRNPDYP